MEQGVKQGMEQGVEQGVKQGVKQGEAMALQRNLIRLLVQRFGGVPEEVSSTIRATHAPEQLEAWLERLLSAQTLTEIGIRPTAVPSANPKKDSGRRKSSAGA